MLIDPKYKTAVEEGVGKADMNVEKRLKEAQKKALKNNQLWLAKTLTMKLHQWRASERNRLLTSVGG